MTDFPWPTLTLDEVCLRGKGIYGLNAAAIDDPRGPRFLRTTDMISGRIEWAGVPSCDIAVDARSKYGLQAGDIVVSRIGANAGASAFVRSPPEGAVFAGYLVRFRPVPERVNPRFLGYALQSPGWREYVNGARTGSAQPQFNAVRMGQFRFSCPPLPIQRRIAAVLGALDDLIETNQRLCKSASSLVRALFHNALGDLRPELKPEWGVGTFAGLVDILGGGTPNTGDAEAWGGDIPWYSVVDAPEPSEIWCIETEKTITPHGLSSSSTRLLPVGATIISARGTVGRLALVGVPMAFNQSCYGLVSRFDAPVFTYSATEALVGQLQRMAHGSVFSTITRDTLDAVQIALPPAPVVKDFESQVSSLAEAIHGYLTENLQLRRTRDELLPLLMSGRVSPGEVDLGV